MLMLTNIWWTLVLVDILLVSSWGIRENCQIPMESKDYDVVFYTHYCNHGRGMMRMQEPDIIFGCQNRERLKILNFKAIVQRQGASDSDCTLGMFGYGYKVNTSCLQPMIRDAIIKPFLEELSGKTPEFVTAFRPAFRSRYKQIALEYECEFEHNKKVDICEPLSETLHGKYSVSFYFKEDTYRRDTDHTSCYCHFTAVNTTLRIIAQAFDIRLHRSNQLLINHDRLDPDQIYWWQSGVLNPDVGLSRVSLSGLSLDTLPDSVWMDIRGTNMKIECYQLKEGETEKEKETGDKNALARSGSSSSSFGTGYILLTVLAIVVIIIIVAIVVKCLISRRSKSSKRDSYSLGESDASQMFHKSSRDDSLRDSDHPPTRVIYAKPDEPTVRLDKKSEDRALLCQTETEDDKGDDDNTSSQRVILDDSRGTTNDTETTIYNHFNDQPDVVPDPSNNIYNTTAAEVYSTFQNKRQESVTESTEPMYDVA